MIPASHIIIDGDTALLLVVPDPKRGGISGRWFARPCDTCGGSGSPFADGDYDDIQHQERTPYGDSPIEVAYDCEDCDGIGRHTLTVETPNRTGQVTQSADGILQVRVHVIDVLPIINASSRPSDNLTERCLVMWHDYAELFDPDPSAQRWTRTTLPPAAAPGMWLVRLAVHT